MRNIFLIHFFIAIFSITNLCAYSQNQERPKLGLVLSGGGAKGFAHIGVLKVLEEYNIPIDYIGGTSMGSIVAGLYAIGYDAAAIEKLVCEQNWEQVLTDKISWEGLSIDEKEQAQKFFVSFPISETGIELPSGLIAGQNISAILNKLTWASYQFPDFSSFPIPYTTVGADIVTGESVELNKGSLPRAMRASMAIPTVFTPVEIDDKLLVDGGLVNNLPVQEVINLGADIIIAVDVQRKPLTKKEINSVIRIMQQASGILRKPALEKSRKLSDILIKPDISNFEVSSFNQADSIIASGVNACRQMAGELKALENTMKSYGFIKSDKNHNPQTDSLYFEDILISGSNNVTREFILNKLQLKTPGWLNPTMLDHAIAKAYGTNFFDKITYTLEKKGEKNYIQIEVMERQEDVFQVGAHYDNIYKSALLLNATFRNLYRKGSKLSFDLALGQNPRFLGQYFYVTKRKNQLGLRVDANSIEAFEYSEGQKTSAYRYRDFITDIMIKTSYKEVYSVGLGMQFELSSISPKVSIWDFDRLSGRYLNFFSYFKEDDLNKSFYPTLGSRTDISMKIVKELENFNTTLPVLVLNYNRQSVIPVKDRFNMIVRTSLGTAIGDSIPYPYKSYFGGLGKFFKGAKPFVGLDFMERSGNHSISAGLDMQFQVYKEHYAVIRSDFGKITENIPDMFTFDNFLAGVGLTYGYNSPMGPLEFTIMGSTNSDKLRYHINIGYWF